MTMRRVILFNDWFVLFLFRLFNWSLKCPQYNTYYRCASATTKLPTRPDSQRASPGAGGKVSSQDVCALLWSCSCSHQLPRHHVMLTTNITTLLTYLFTTCDLVHIPYPSAPFLSHMFDVSPNPSLLFFSQIMCSSLLSHRDNFWLFLSTLHSAGEPSIIMHSSHLISCVTSDIGRRKSHSRRLVVSRKEWTCYNSVCFL